MNFSPKCYTMKLVMINMIFGSFCSFFNWEGADIQPQIRSRKISEIEQCYIYSEKTVYGWDGMERQTNVGMKRGKLLCMSVV